MKRKRDNADINTKNKKRIVVGKEFRERERETVGTQEEGEERLEMEMIKNEQINETREPRGRSRVG